MPTFNVLVAVIELVDAETPEDAVNALARRLVRAGFETYADEDGEPRGLPHVFLSDVDTEGNPQ